VTGKPISRGDKLYGPRLAQEIPALCDWLVSEGQVVGMEFEEELQAGSEAGWSARRRQSNVKVTGRKRMI
jgi:hypothetical protein